MIYFIQNLVRNMILDCGMNQNFVTNVGRRMSGSIIWCIKNVFGILLLPKCGAIC